MANVPISRPNPLPNNRVNVNLGSIGFSYDTGLMYEVYDNGADDLIKLPPSMGSGR